MGLSTKGTITNEGKLIARTSEVENEFPNEVVVHVGAEGDEELSSVRKQDGRRTALRARLASNASKDSCHRNGLAPDYNMTHFS